MITTGIEKRCEVNWLHEVNERCKFRWKNHEMRHDKLQCHQISKNAKSSESPVFIDPLQHAVKRDFCPFHAGSSNKRSQAYRVAQVGHICPTKETSCQSKTGASAPKLTLKSQRTWLKNTSFYTHVLLRICRIFLRLSLPKVRQNHASQMY